MNKVNNEQRGELAGQRNAQVHDMATQNAISKDTIVLYSSRCSQSISSQRTGERRARWTEKRTSGRHDNPQRDEYATSVTDETEAPKVEVVNEQVRTEFARASARGDETAQDKEEEEEESPLE